MSLKKKLIGSLVTILISQPALSQNTVVDEILRDYKQSTSFAHFLSLFQAKVIPGDDVFLYKKMKNSPDLLRAKKLPSMIYENGMFTLRYIKAEYNFRLADRDKFEFEINSQKVILHPSMIPSLRWAKINDIVTPKATSFISFMPIAYAQQNGEPTFSNVIVFSVLSRLALEATHGLEIKTENPGITYLQMMKKVKEYRSYCDVNYLAEFMQRMASVQSTNVQCESSAPKGKAEGHLNGNIRFEIPFGDNTVRVIRLNRAKQIVEEDAPDFPDKKLVYRKLYTETKIDFAHADPTEKKKRRTLRQKGMEWVSVGEKSDEIQERAEQIREMVNFAYSTDFCNRCGLTIRKALKELSVDLQMNPNVDQYGNEMTKDAPKAGKK